ncbi:MAG TPA: glycosyltransferase family 39 protein [Reyranella sp.]|nr:glycosyltransferase family 39 protein [Reyranella sp.]
MTIGKSTRANESPGRLLAGVAVAATALVLAVRLVFASQVNFCGGADACYYFALAREIASRHDFLLNFVWNYQSDRIDLPNLAGTYWRPGTSLLLQITAPLGEVSLRSSAMMASLATIVAALAAADFVRSLTSRTRTALLAYIIALCLPTFWVIALQADSAVFYGAAVSWFLVLFLPTHRNVARDVLALLCLAAAYLIRNDAILLAVPFAAVLAIRTRESAVERRYALVLAGAFALALLPTHLVTWWITGRLTNGSILSVLFFHDIADFSSYGRRLNFASWWAIGPAALLEQRGAVLIQIMHHLMMSFGGAATVLAIVGVAIGLLSRPSTFARTLAGPAAFLLSMVLVYAFVLPAIGDHAAQRSYTGFLPILAALAAYCIDEIAVSRPAWLALSTVVVSFLAFDGINRARITLDDNRKELAQYHAEAQLIERSSPKPRQALAMVANPAVFTTTTGIPSVALPTNGPAAVRQAARDFNATAIVVDRWSHILSDDRELAAAPRLGVPGSQLVVISLIGAGADGL